MNELPIPPRASRSENDRELLRVWAANGEQHVSIATGLWKDPAMWGIMIVDLMKHVANAYEQTSASDKAEVLARIKSGFDVEWADATDTPTGGLHR